jgi:hypothetical protein
VERKSGAEGIRTPDPLIANEVRYQLRYSPKRTFARVSLPAHEGKKP